MRDTKLLETFKKRIEKELKEKERLQKDEMAKEKLS